MDLRAGCDDAGNFRLGREGRRQSRSAACGASAVRATLFIVALLASLLFAAAEVRFGLTPSDLDATTTM
jgi:hypothetical protein